jgi:iron complex outermembrane receptor protein
MSHYRLKKRIPVSFKDVSGSTLPGVSKWAGSLGGEYTKSAKF